MSGALSGKEGVRRDAGEERGRLVTVKVAVDKASGGADGMLTKTGQRDRVTHLSRRRQQVGDESRGIVEQRLHEALVDLAVSP